MRTLQRSLPVTFLCLTAILAHAQPKQPPSAVSEAFTKMFPEAQNADWKDKSDHFTVFFTLAGQKCEAKYAPAGDWLGTQMPVPLDSLPPSLTDSLKVCRYSDWIPSSAYVFRFAKEPTQYHLVMTKPGQGKKILLFSTGGHLLAAH